MTANSLLQIQPRSSARDLGGSCIPECVLALVLGAAQFSGCPVGCQHGTRTCPCLEGYVQWQPEERLLFFSFSFFFQHFCHLFHVLNGTQRKFFLSLQGCPSPRICQCNLSLVSVQPNDANQHLPLFYSSLHDSLQPNAKNIILYVVSLVRLLCLLSLLNQPKITRNDLLFSRVRYMAPFQRGRLHSRKTEGHST